MNALKLILTGLTLISTLNTFGAIEHGNNPHASLSFAIGSLIALTGVNLMEKNK